MLKTDYNIPILEDEDIADLNKYSNEMAKALKTQINNTNNEIKEIDQKVVDAVNKFTEPISYKGKVATFNDLPSGAKEGNIYTVTSENKNYIWNGTSWEEYSSNIDLTPIEEQLKTTQITEIAEELSIPNTAPVNAKLDIKSGKSEQETNLSDGKLEQGTITEGVENDTTDRIRTANPIKVISDSKVVVNATANTTLQYLLVYYNALNNFLYNGSWVNIGVETTIPSNVNYIRIILRKSDSSSITTTDVSNFNVENTPSPDYPIDIRNVGDNINLFDKNNANILDGVYVDGNGTLNSSNTRKTLYIPCKPNTSYSVQKRQGIIFRIGTVSTIPQLNVTGTFLFIEETGSKAIVVTPNDAEYLCVTYYANTYDTLTEQEILDSIKIEEGSIATSYSKYGCGSVGFIAQNKNKVNLQKWFNAVNANLCTKTLLENGVQIDFTAGDDAFVGFVLGAGSVLSENRRTQLIEVKTSKKYTLSLSSAPNCYIGMFDENYTSLGFYQVPSSYSKTSYTFTPVVNTKYITIRLGVRSADYTTYQFTDIQLEEGNVATEYIEHQEQTIVFPLSKGQLLHKGDYLAEDGIHQNRRIYIADGTENLEISTSSNYTRFRFSMPYMSNAGESRNLNLLSNYFKPSKVDDYGICYMYGSYGYFYPNSEITTVEQWKSYLAELYATGNPLKIEYPIDETVIPYTPEQEQAYYELQHLLMYEGYTSIECIDEIKPDIQVTYSYNNEINTTYGKRFDEVDSNIKELENKHIYSLEEQVIGKWIDGKPLYRKVIDIGNLPNATTKNVSLNISNLKNIIKMEGYVRGSNFWLPLPYSNNITIMCNSTVVGVTTISDRSDCTGYVTLYYTKTTD